MKYLIRINEKWYQLPVRRKTTTSSFDTIGEMYFTYGSLVQYCNVIYSPKDKSFIKDRDGDTTAAAMDLMIFNAGGLSAFPELDARVFTTTYRSNEEIDDLLS